ncbi:PucR family transcriptional regulator [Anaerosinus massiliensis]|uniref:PucR family transcriptional regulator n=1 Tax=Massilibacillus massiliensis TaxID=1806837 RepID=UPI000DA62E34|nr:helix-turn-helix domain-containing protein [Massilibacillus massiliensis]
MKNNSIDEIGILDKLLNEGISSVGYDFEKITKKEIVMGNHYGEIFYASPNIDCNRFKILLSKLPPISETEYYYRKRDHLLFYQLSKQKQKFIIALNNVNQEDILLFVEKIQLLKLALKTFMDIQYRAQQHTKQFEKNFVETLIKSSATIHDIIGLNNIDLKTDQQYSIFLIVADSLTINLGEFTKSLFETCTRIDSIKIFPPILWNDAIVVIIPAEQMISVKSQQSACMCIEKALDDWRTKSEEKLKLQISCGLGQFYLLTDLHKSYIEAKIALAFPQLMKKTSTLQAFHNLGVFSMIFSQDILTLKDYALKTLNPIIEYDRTTKMQLVDTLRILLNNDLNWTQTSKLMFVHVNTIHYRYDKIEKLLLLDLSTGKTRGNVFAALKIWDVLNKIGFIEK